MQKLILVITALTLAGCAAHQISFQDIDYLIDTQKYDRKVTVVLDSKTLNDQVTIKSFMTGIGQDWNAQPGLMTKQVADIEFPQMFSDYKFQEVFLEPEKGTSNITLTIQIPRYVFSSFRATITLAAKAYVAKKMILLDKTYAETGISQGGKMFWGGAFGMKSAVRQSSFDALKKIFITLRHDLVDAMKTTSS